MTHTENEPMSDDTKGKILAVALEDAAMESDCPPPRISLASSLSELVEWLKWSDLNVDYGNLASTEEAWEIVAERCADGLES